MLRIALLCWLVGMAWIAPDAVQAGGAACPPGTAGVNGSEPCFPCEAGTYAPNPGSTACQPCAIGSAASGTGFAECLTCDPGSAAPQPGMASCEPCAAGTAVDYYGAPACLDCPPGYYADQPGMTACLMCNAGSFASQFRSSSCEQCPAGTYNFMLGVSECTACAPGTASAAVGASDPSACAACPAGRFAVAAGSAACDACPRNSYAPSSGATQCLACSCDDAVACTRDACNASSGACSAPPVPACQPVEVAFSGEVTYIDARLGSSVTAGEPVEGRLTWDPEAPDHAPLDAIWGDYRNGVVSFEVSIGNGAALTATGPGGYVTVLYGSGDGDSITFDILDDDGLVGPSFPAVPDGVADQYRLHFRDPGAAALSSDALPAGGLDFGLFSIRSGLLEIASPTIGNSYVIADELIDAPEPGAVAIGAIALLSLAVRRRIR